VARIDQSLDNLIVDPETTAVTGWLDWEFCVAATPAYDLAFVEHSLAGGHWAFLPDVPDHRETIRRGLREGYAETGPENVLEQARADGAYYALLAEAHAMTTFESWFADLDVVEASEEDLDAAAERLRERALTLADEQ
jgi:Ser/Thr protein kinase RdoA (MazF antagonist)